jgi:radical SAM protein with 4Fe4S-binding SPASM domain
VHLRIESDGSGLMVIDASKVIHLNRTACDFAFLMLSGAGREEAVDRIRRRYRAGRAQLEADWDEFMGTVECLLGDEPVCPVTFLGLDRIEPFRTPVSAPYRADLALTYRCNVDCGHCYNEKREAVELDTAKWREVINRLWDAGVPHVAFTGGEATLRDDLPDLVAHAESVGMVSGLLTNGVKLADPAYLARLVGAGLDYVQITLESSDEAVHNGMTRADSFGATVQGLRNCISSGVYAITNTTITGANQGTLETLVDFVADMGLKSMAFNSVIRSGRAAAGDFGIETGRLRLLLEKLREKTAGRGLRLIWYSPTRYCELDPLDLQLGPKRCTAGQYNVCIEPDGSVLPCQSYYESAGNILEEPWERIYDCGLMRALREREWVDNDCRVCDRFGLCGGGCPLESRGNPVGCPDMLSNP